MRRKNSHDRDIWLCPRCQKVYTACMMYIISGVCGVGKTSVMPGLSTRLDPHRYVIHDFDERGVPDGADKAWRIAELRQWLEIARDNAQKGLSTVICGFTKSSDLEALQVQNAPEVKLVLLHAEPEIVRKRLEGRYSKHGVFDATQTVIGKPVTEFIEGNVWYASHMLAEFQEHDGTVIDTSELTPDEVAEQIVKVISSSTT